MITFLLVVQAIVAAMLVGVILMQRSEGGGLGMGGSPSGLMSARGAADFLTRATTVLATIFVALSLTMAVLASQRQGGGKIDTSLAKQREATEAIPLSQPDAAANVAVPMAAPAPAPKAVVGATEQRPAPKAATAPTVVPMAAPTPPANAN
ncbi:MAG: preprotein translocase subunit SecG [Sphingomonadaceae bacterium]